MKTSTVIWAVLFATAATIVPATRAAFTEPLHVSNSSALTDVFDRTLDGPAYPSPARVDVFTTSGSLRPAVFLTNTYVGVDAASPGGGYFVLTIPERPQAGSVITLVAYDAATSNAASYYRRASRDVPQSGDLSLTFDDPTPMSKFGDDPDIADAAAYADALERMHESGVDSDEDGMTDWEEVYAGTFLDDPGSLLAFEIISVPPAGDVIEHPASSEEPAGTMVTIQWQSVPGTRYLLQYTPSLLSDIKDEPVEWKKVLRRTAGEDEYSIRVTVDQDAEGNPIPPAAHFRVKLDL